MPRRNSLSDGEIVPRKEKGLINKTNKCLQKWFALLALFFGVLFIVAYCVLPVVCAGLYKAIPFVESVCDMCTSVMMWLAK